MLFVVVSLLSGCMTIEGTAIPEPASSPERASSAAHPMKDLRDPARTQRVNAFRQVDVCGFIDEAALEDVVGVAAYDIGMTGDIGSCEVTFDEAESPVLKSISVSAEIRTGSPDPWAKMRIGDVDVSWKGSVLEGSCSFSPPYDRDRALFYSFWAPRSKDGLGGNGSDPCPMAIELMKRFSPRFSSTALRRDSPYRVRTKLAAVDPCDAIVELNKTTPVAAIRDEFTVATCHFEFPGDNGHRSITGFMSDDTHVVESLRAQQKSASDLLEYLWIEGFPADLQRLGPRCRGVVFVGIEEPITWTTLSSPDSQIPGLQTPRELAWRAVDAYIFDEYGKEGDVPDCDTVISVLGAAARVYRGRR